MSIPFADNRIGSRRALPQRSADGHTAEHPVNMPRTLRCRFHMFHILLFPVSRPCVCGEKFVDLLSTDISLHDDHLRQIRTKQRQTPDFPGASLGIRPAAFRLASQPSPRRAARGRVEDYFAAFDLYGGIEDFRGILREVATLPERDMNFVCKVFDLKKEELRCYTRRQLRLQLWDY